MCVCAVECLGDIVLPKIPEVYLSVFISLCVYLCVFLLAFTHKSDSQDIVLLLCVC